MRRTRGVTARLDHLGDLARKFAWGVRTVGLPEALRGAVRLAALRWRRPERARITLRSGPVLEYAVPAQVAPALVVFRDLIDPEFAFLRAVARPDWLVLDVGAAIGQFTTFAARLPVAHVHAYEPNAANLESLHRNLDLNDVAARVSVHAAALGETEGEVVFEETDNAYLSHLSSTGQGVRVPVHTLDAEVERLGLDRVSVLKVNVAGHEPAALAGGSDLLRAGRADILVLLIGEQSLGAYQQCQQWGYRFFFFHPRRRELHPVTELSTAGLSRRPWPARHVIGVHQGAIDRGLLASVAILDRDHGATVG